MLSSIYIIFSLLSFHFRYGHNNSFYSFISIPMDCWVSISTHIFYSRPGKSCEHILHHASVVPFYATGSRLLMLSLDERRLNSGSIPASRPTLCVRLLLKLPWTSTVYLISSDFHDWDVRIQIGLITPKIDYLRSSWHHTPLRDTTTVITVIWMIFGS